MMVEAFNAEMSIAQFNEAMRDPAYLENPLVAPVYRFARACIHPGDPGSVYEYGILTSHFIAGKAALMDIEARRPKTPLEGDAVNVYATVRTYDRLYVVKYNKPKVLGKLAAYLGIEAPDFRVHLPRFNHYT